MSYNKKKIKEEIIRIISFTRYETGIFFKLVSEDNDMNIDSILKTKPDESLMIKFKLGLYFGLILINDEKTYKKLTIKNKLVFVKLLEYCLDNYIEIKTMADRYIEDLEDMLRKNDYLLRLFKYVKDEDMEEIDDINILNDEEVYQNIKMEKNSFYYDPNIIGNLMIYLYKCKLQCVKNDYYIIEDDDILTIKDIKPLYHKSYVMETDDPDLEGLRHEILEYIRYKDLTTIYLYKKINIFENIEHLKDANTFYEKFISRTYEYIRNSMVNYQLLEWFFLLGIHYNKLNDLIVENLFMLLFKSNNTGLTSDIILDRKDIPEEIKKLRYSYTLGKGDDSIISLFNTLDCPVINKIYEKKIKTYTYICIKLDDNYAFNKTLLSDEFLNIITKYSPSITSYDRIINEIISSINATVDDNMKDYNTYLLVNSEGKEFEYRSNKTMIEIDPVKIDEISINLFNKKYIKFSITDSLLKFSIEPKENVIIEKNNSIRNLRDISKILLDTIEADASLLNIYKTIITEKISPKNKSIVKLFSNRYLNT